MSNTEVMVKEALLQCQNAGCTVRFLRADEMNIHICTGCISCVVGMTTGRGKGGCPIKDDLPIVEEALMEADAVIIGSPVYEFTPPPATSRSGATVWAPPTTFPSARPPMRKAWRQARTRAFCPTSAASKSGWAL